MRIEERIILPLPMGDRVCPLKMAFSSMDKKWLKGAPSWLICSSKIQSKIASLKMDFVMDIYGNTDLRAWLQPRPICAIFSTRLF